MRDCVDCKTPRPTEDFPPCGKGKRSARCRPCKQQYDRNYYLANKEKMKGQRKLTRPEAKKKVQRAVWDYLKANPCPCGEADPVVLEFDHRDPSQKIMAIADMILRRYTLTKVMTEIAKCDVLCANCHRRRTADQFGWYKLIEM